MTMSGGAGAASVVTTLELEPVEAIRAECQEIRDLANTRKLGVAQNLYGDEPGEARKVELHRLHVVREIGHAEDRVAFVLAKIDENPGVGRLEKPQRADAEHWEELAQADEVLHPLQQRGAIAFLRLDVDRLVTVDGVHDHRTVEARRIRTGEAGIPIAGPLHRRPDAISVAKVDVVAHADLVAVVDDGGSRKREEQTLEQLDTPAVIAHQRRQTSADAEVETSL